MDLLKAQGIHIDAMRVMAFPFHQQVSDFIDAHPTLIIVEQNRDAQFRTLLINELELYPDRLLSVINYDGMPITADAICKQIKSHLSVEVI